MTKRNIIRYIFFHTTHTFFEFLIKSEYLDIQNMMTFSGQGNKTGIFRRWRGSLLVFTCD